MIKLSYFAAAAVAFLAAPAAFAAEAEDGAFAHKGVQYSYTTEEAAGEKVIRGTAYAGKVPFELHVRKKTVTGTFNNRPVEFRLADVKKLGIDVEGAK
ncbi:hypothetical protein [Novosphingobium cyanobacteriorum]|uniref:Uncharacterized protein n=1 Tax=Novosphingobium cyanobacteriorum TaxID=3024215 RepID=A0ABT6CJ80_9SPHN|nr:hypothetical protein [Novosphingobium cyanobacteriorum]MDF8333966.1 hypothetical protein [Novosphingobium cyanobacteriorum]